MDDLAQVAVVGAGPAGLAAAVAVADGGLSVVLIDAGGQPGGQYWRHPDEVHGDAGDEGTGHHEWHVFVDLRARLDAHERTGRIRYARGTQVWLLERDRDRDREEEREHGRWSVHIRPISPVRQDSDTACGGLGRVRAGHLILCPGGYDRQLPVPGWTLPGVMAAGGVQAMIKANRVRPGRRVVVAGTGPFLLSVASALAASGAQVAAICDANRPGRWLRDIPGALTQPAKVREGAEYLATLARHRIPYRAGWAVTAVHGDDRVAAATISRLDSAGRPVVGSATRLDCDLVALGWGFTPSLELPIAAGVDTRVDVDGSLVAAVDEDQRTDVAGVSVAGEATGIGGAMLAVAEGELAGLVIADECAAADGRHRSGAVARRRRIRRLRGIIRRGRTFARAMHRATPIPEGWSDWLTDDTVVCRCEEVPYLAVRFARDELGADDGRTLRSLTRCGMGWCQGRVCGFAVSRLGAPGFESDAVRLQQTGGRSIASPVPLGAVARLASDETTPPPVRSKKSAHR